MTDLDKHVYVFARAVATLGVNYIDPFTLQTFFSPRGVGKKLVEISGVIMEHIGPDESHGFDLRQFVDAFLERFPAWKELESRKGVGIDYQASAHAKLAWMAFSRQVRAELGVGP